MKTTIFLTLTALVIFFSSCSPNQVTNEGSPEQSEQTTTIDNHAKIVGDWESENENQTYYLSIRSYSKKSIDYSDESPAIKDKNHKKLSIETITDQSITALSEDKKTRYLFLFSEDERITVNFGVNSEYYSDKKPSEMPVGLSKPILYHRLSN